MCEGCPDCYWRGSCSVWVAQFQVRGCYRGSQYRPDFDPRGLEKHGGWAPNSGNMLGYTDDSVVAAMTVSNVLAL